ncbi:MAG: helix-turn-helix domain-containing protein [Candidatus Gastranaerophilales bacterium]|nr:helix-turn-helix domain-containing protein [Candidatus Gastranaerophilales bacterium]
MAKSKNAITEYRSYYLPLHFPVLLLSGDHWKISDVPSGRLHFHNCLEIGICHSHSGYIEIFCEQMPFQVGDVTVIPKNVPHTTYSTSGTESLWSYIYLDPRELFRNLLPATWQNYDLAAYAFRGYKYILSRAEYPEIYELVMLSVKELQTQKSNYHLSARGLLLSLYINLYRIQSTAQNGESSDQKEAFKQSEERSPEKMLAIAPVLDYIENNYMQQFTIEYLAQLCHWSPTHFRRVFHEIIGKSPLEHVNNIRIMKACGLLQSTERSILDISEMVGFRSVSSFNRCFSKAMQMPPREYRKQTQQTDPHAASRTIQEYAGWMYPE